MRFRLVIVGLLLLGLSAVTGRGLEDPYAKDEGEGFAGGGTAVAQIGDEAPLPKHAKDAVEDFATAWIVWTSNETPDARQALLALSATPFERELFRRGGAASGALPGAQVSARVEGIVPKGGGRALVVTHEKVRFESGDVQARYGVYVARAQRSDDGWEVIEWQPVL